MKKIANYFSISMTLLLLISSSGTAIPIEKNSEPVLTIYTYDSLLADTYYDWVSAFESYANLSVGSIEVVAQPDAGGILTQAVVEKANPIADVLIGLDNALIHKARSEDILEPYQPKGSDKLVEGLVDGLASDYLLTPYDYGLISLWYDKTRITLDQNDFKLEDLVSQDLSSKLVIENPITSTPGLGFLLWTIAVYGDKNSNVDGLLNEDWKVFWEDLSKDVRIMDSWGEALDVFYTPEADRPIMVSYSSSTSYGICNYNDTTTGALVSTENGSPSAWKQIEGLGVVKNSDNPELAKIFVDWFISEELQSQIHKSQWMYPARQEIAIPDCYDTTFDPSTINTLNDEIDQSTLNSNLEGWLDEWETTVIEGKDDSNFLDVSPFLVITILILPLIRRRTSQYKK